MMKKLNQPNNTTLQLSKSKKQLKKDYIRQQQLHQHHYFACDLECTTKPPYNVYMVTLEEVHTNQQWQFTNLDDLFSFMTQTYPNSTLYFHNGYNYDFEFIINWVFNQQNYSISLNKQYAIKRVLDEYEITKTGKIKTHKGKYVKRTAHIKLLDSRSVLTTGSIESLGQSIGLAKGHGIISTPLVAYIYDDKWVEQIDQYGRTETRTSNFIQHCHDVGWWKYAIQDTHILAEVVKAYGLITHAELKQYTAAGIAYHEMIQHNEEYVEYLKEQNKVGNKEIAMLFNRVARLAYRGGFTWVNYELKDELHHKPGVYVDYTSMYPYIYMNPDKFPLPMRQPTNRKTDLYIIHYKNLKCTVKEGCVPILKLRTETGNMGKLTNNLPHAKYYLNNFVGDIALTKPEVEYLYECYENITFDKAKPYYYEENVMLEKALKLHGQKWFERKNKAKMRKDAPDELYSKLMLNTAYGYLGFFEKPIGKYEYSLDQQTNTVIKNKTADIPTGLTFAEVPAAAFITAYGRVKLAKAVNKVGVHRTLATDTDSMVVLDSTVDELKQLFTVTLKDEEPILGEFSLEDTFEYATAIRAKTWCIADENFKPIKQSTAGSNYKFNDIRNFKKGEIIVSSTKDVGPGGVGIVMQPKVLGEMDNYDEWM